MNSVPFAYLISWYKQTPQLGMYNNNRIPYEHPKPPKITVHTIGRRVLLTHILLHPSPPKFS
jgi:hypothetical protein